MTEAEWIACEDPARMLDHHQWVGGPRPNPLTSDRKLRLWAEAAGCMHCHSAYKENTALWADSVSKCESCKPPSDKANLLRDINGNPWNPVTLPKSARECDRCGGCGYTPRDPDIGPGYGTLTRSERQTCGLCRGKGAVHGPCPWLTPTVLALAEAAYEERTWRWVQHPNTGDSTGHFVEDGTLDPVRLAVLRDALLDAECDSEDLLGHLISAGPHVRGCWAIDLLLGRN